MDEDLELTVDGTVYHSLDALPAELREKLAAHVEKARARRRGGPRPGSRERGRCWRRRKAAAGGSGCSGRWRWPDSFCFSSV